MMSNRGRLPADPGPGRFVSRHAFEGAGLGGVLGLSPRRRYDPFGAVSITAALLVFVYAISQAPQVGWAATQTVGMLAAGCAVHPANVAQ